ncbi:hypothetical protein DLAC_07010 [Tieghemostelium lacteum]|uniref:Uncharacterized protein n=1 Tax=Tieghemostelium lacteum TaxID=361077 RepID=A0A151ZE23_TIELA|nr:hypothetical protein DLAC_07010 [Tieghemostelium lacteum]|eukprot:KYQ92169.1 hypothetical protein DLAC_07010 [Tieghemostelium lacteum]
MQHGEITIFDLQHRFNQLNIDDYNQIYFFKLELNNFIENQLKVYDHQLESLLIEFIRKFYIDDILIHSDYLNWVYSKNAIQRQLLFSFYTHDFILKPKSQIFEVFYIGLQDENAVVQKSALSAFCNYFQKPSCKRLLDIKILSLIANILKKTTGLFLVTALDEYFATYFTDRTSFFRNYYQLTERDNLSLLNVLLDLMDTSLTTDCFKHFHILIYIIFDERLLSTLTPHQLLILQPRLLNAIKYLFQYSYIYLQHIEQNNNCLSIFKDKTFRDSIQEPLKIWLLDLFNQRKTEPSPSEHNIVMSSLVIFHEYYDDPSLVSDIAEYAFSHDTSNIVLKHFLKLYTHKFAEMGSFYSFLIAQPNYKLGCTHLIAFKSLIKMKSFDKKVINSYFAMFLESYISNNNFQLINYLINASYYNNFYNDHTIEFKQAQYILLKDRSLGRFSLLDSVTNVILECGNTLAISNFIEGLLGTIEQLQIVKIERDLIMPCVLALVRLYQLDKKNQLLLNMAKSSLVLSSKISVEGQKVFIKLLKTVPMDFWKCNIQQFNVITISEDEEIPEYNVNENPLALGAVLDCIETCSKMTYVSNYIAKHYPTNNVTPKMALYYLHHCQQSSIAISVADTLSIWFENWSISNTYFNVYSFVQPVVKLLETEAPNRLLALFQNLFSQDRNSQLLVTIAIEQFRDQKLYNTVMNSFITSLKKLYSNPKNIQTKKFQLETFIEGLNFSKRLDENHLMLLTEFIFEFKFIDCLQKLILYFPDLISKSKKFMSRLNDTLPIKHKKELIDFLVK